MWIYYIEYGIEFQEAHHVYDSYYRLSSNFGVITYSYDTLAVIQARTSVFENVDDFYPKYLARFNVPKDKETEQLIYLTYD